jgi:hypothetical protein
MICVRNGRSKNMKYVFEWREIIVKCDTCPMYEECGAEWCNAMLEYTPIDIDTSETKPDWCPLQKVED